MAKKPATLKLKIHPLADSVPKMTVAEYDALKADIEANGLREPIWVKGELIVDGRHRYRACRELGVPIQTRAYDGDDIEAFVISTNVARRHLTRRQRRYFVERLLRLHPEKSDRAIAAEVGASAPAVASVRRELEPTVRTLQLNERTGLDGKTRRMPAPSHSIASLVTRKDLEFKRFIKWLSDLHPSELTDPSIVVSQMSDQLSRLASFMEQQQPGAQTR